MNNMRAIVTVGVSASGKSTWARESGLAVVERDKLRRVILRGKLHRQLEPGDLWKHWKWKDEDQVSKMYDDHLCFHSANREDIVCADTNLSLKYRVRLVNRLVELGYDVEIKAFPVTLEEAWKRDAGRPDGVGHSVIAKQYEQWLDYVGRDVFVPIVKRSAIIVDIDGTLAHMNGNRSPYEWEKVGLDEVDVAVKTIVNHMCEESTIIVLSGRDSVCRSQTIDWLTKHDIVFDALHMRAKGDQRKDAIVKRELFDLHIAKSYTVLFAIDDRPCMVRMWNQMGIKTFAVGNQHIEF